jgi:hypothetical protein
MTEFGLNDDGRTNDQNEDTKDAIADWEEEKTEVPVLFVFAILLVNFSLTLLDFR